MSITISVQLGDATTVIADALIAPTNPKGDRTGGIDLAIRTVAGVGDAFHQHLLRQPLNDGNVIHATPQLTRRAAFGSVLLVVDHLEQPLRGIIGAALVKANDLRLRRVTLPLLRTGKQAYAYELYEQAVAELALSMTSFALMDNLYIVQLNVVIHPDDIVALDLLRRHMSVFRHYLSKMRHDGIRVDII